VEVETLDPLEIEGRHRARCRRARRDDGRREVAEIHPIAFGEDRDPLGHVRQLPDVARPGVGQEPRSHGRVDLWDTPTLLAAGALQETLEERQDIVAPGPERGNFEVDGP
jgi:hypothetical protein